MLPLRRVHILQVVPHTESEHAPMQDMYLVLYDLSCPLSIDKMRRALKLQSGCRKATTS
jgi:hypothetical protein